MINDGASVRGGVPLRGRVRVVPDKSLTHRGVLLGSVCRGRTVLEDPNAGDDCRATLAAVAAFGVRVEETPAGAGGGSRRWILEPPEGGLREPEGVLDLGNSGTGIRLLAGIAAAHPFLSILTGDASLRRRPMARIVEPLRAMGAAIDARAGLLAPLVIRGGGLRAVEWTSPVASAQVKSAVLLAGLGVGTGEVAVCESAPSRDHTERLLEWLGADLRREEGSVRLRPGRVLEARPWRVPGDASSAAFFCVAAAVTPGSRIQVEGVGLNPGRTGFLDVLRRMGARLEVRPSGVEGPEPVGTVAIEHGPLRGTEVGGTEIPSLIDEIPVLAVAAAYAEGTTRFEDLSELRHKESDRIASTCAMLRALGVSVEEGSDGFTVAGAGGVRGGRVSAHDDHRIAMSALVAGCGAADAVEVDSLRMVATSDPGFLERLERLRAGTDAEEGDRT